MRARLLLCLGAASAALIASFAFVPDARAQDTAALQPPPQVGQRTFGLVARGGADGAYGGFRLGTSRVGVEATGGYAPVVALEKKVEPWFPYHDAQYFSTAQLNGELYFFPWRTHNKVQFGFDAHYAYNTLLLSGAGAAFRFDIAISRTLVGGFRVGGTWFPQAIDRVQAKAGPDVEINKLMTEMSGFASFELAWYPN